MSDAVFATTGESPDGMTVDEQGNVYVASKAGIQVFSSEGMLWDTLDVPLQPTNCTLGDDTLFITARRSVYALALSQP